MTFSFRGRIMPTRLTRSILSSDVDLYLYVPGVDKSAADGAMLDAGTAVLSADAKIPGPCIPS